ncbi:MAG TPA: alpha/beta hydrolase [Longimicrobiaceae bacterium]|nr:alpha/beta hydrolase [Longimicrobiaceae bacterium]
MSNPAYEASFRRWAAANGVGWQRIVYPRDEYGSTVAYRLTPAGELSGTVLLVHGAGNDALFGMVGLAKRLISRNFQVITFDLDGHGRDSGSRFSGTTIGGAVAEAVRRLPTDREVPLHAVGISLGGALLLHTLAKAGCGISSAILMVAPLRIEFSRAAFAAELRPRLLRTLWRERAHYGLAGLVPSFGPFKRATYPLRFAPSEVVGTGAFGYIEVLDRTLASLDLEEAARTNTVPTLLIYGDADRIVPIEQGKRLERLIPSARLLSISGGTHLTTPLAAEAVSSALEWIDDHAVAARQTR